MELKELQKEERKKESLSAKLMVGHLNGRVLRSPTVPQDFRCLPLGLWSQNIPSVCVCSLCYAFKMLTIPSDVEGEETGSSTDTDSS
jgi:hypothetical protein